MNSLFIYVIHISFVLMSLHIVGSLIKEIQVTKEKYSAAQYLKKKHING